LNSRSRALQVDTKLLERLGVLLILVAALVPRVRDLAAPFDREFEGFQGSCFAAFCVNYERLGVGRFGGYPTYCVDIPDEAAGETLDPALYVYANHPPLVPLAQWAVVKALAPDGWNDAWRSGDAPVGNCNGAVLDGLGVRFHRQNRAANDQLVPVGLFAHSDLQQSCVT